MKISSSDMETNWVSFSACVSAAGVGIAYMPETDTSAMLCAYMPGNRFIFCYVSGQDYAEFAQTIELALLSCERTLTGNAFSAAISIWGPP